MPYYVFECPECGHYAERFMTIKELDIFLKSDNVMVCYECEATMNLIPQPFTNLFRPTRYV
jgi:transcription elongation factor Elf1